MKINELKDVEIALQELALHENKIAKAEVQMNMQINKIKDEFDEKTREDRAYSETIRLDLEDFARKNYKMFEKERTKDFVFGIIGFRKNPPKVTLLNRKYTIKTAIELIKRIFDGTYIRTKQELDKESILADYTQKKLTDENLAAVGLKIDNDESFICEVKFEELAKVEK